MDRSKSAFGPAAPEEKRETVSVTGDLARNRADFHRGGKHTRLAESSCGKTDRQ